MSLITQCPACATMFKVVPDQLRISDGWVRCGQCDVVFDANAHLKTGPHEEPLLADAHDVPSVGAAVQQSSPEPSVENIPFTAAPDDERPIGEPQASPQDSVESDDASHSAFLPAAPEVPLDHVQAQYADGGAPHSFMRTPATGSRRQSKVVRTFLGMSVVLLLMLLCLQVLVQERDKIATLEPASKPVLMSVCKMLNCEVAPLRQIESVVIESSSFTNVRADIYRLSFTLKNTAPLSLATPAVELTLTDLQDQTVVRRVIGPSDFGGSQGAIAAGAEVSATVPMHVKLPSNSEKFSGYRVVIFYP